MKALVFIVIFPAGFGWRSGLFPETRREYTIKINIFPEQHVLHVQ